MLDAVTSAVNKAPLNSVSWRHDAIWSSEERHKVTDGKHYGPRGRGRGNNRGGARGALHNFGRLKDLSAGVQGFTQEWLDMENYSQDYEPANASTDEVNNQ